MSRPIIEVENLSKRYRLGQFNAQTMREEVEHLLTRFWSKGPRGGGSLSGKSSEFWALKDVSFSVQPGEAIGIIGRNGAGKSTLLKILSRVTEPSTGQARIRGRTASLLEIGTGFHPELTGRENIYLNGAILGMTRAEIRAKFDEIVAFAEVDRFLDTPVKRYSSGMCVRLAFSVAAHLEPEILIVDEVLAVGDTEFQKKCLGKMESVSGKGGRTVLFVSHNLTAIKALTQRALLLESGTINFFGPTSDCIQGYLRRTEERGRILPQASDDEFPSHQKDGCHTRVLSVSIVDDAGLPTHYYLSHNPLMLEARIETDGTKGMSFDVYILNSYGQRVLFYTSNLFDNIDLPTCRGRYDIRIALKPLLLASGSYKIDFATAFTRMGYDDYVTHAANFEIPYSNPTGNSWDFRESGGYGLVAMTLEAPVTVNKVQS